MKKYFQKLRLKNWNTDLMPDTVLHISFKEKNQLTHELNVNPLNPKYLDWSYPMSWSGTYHTGL